MELPPLALAFTIGVILGLFYFGGLWLTVQEISQRQWPTLWLLGSLAVRLLMCCLVFYFVIDHDWKPLVACLSGLILMRTMLISLVI